MILLCRLGPSRRFTSTHMTVPRGREGGDTEMALGTGAAGESGGGEGVGEAMGSGGGGEGGDGGGEEKAFFSSWGFWGEAAMIWLFCAGEDRFMSSPNSS